MYLENIQSRDKLTIQSELVKSAVLFLSKDGAGFNGVDTEFGNSLAQILRKRRQLSPAQEYQAWKMCRKYWRQLRKADPEIILPKKWINRYRLEGWQVWNDSKGSGPYTLDLIGDGELSCTCEAYSNGNECGHITLAIAQGLIDSVDDINDESIESTQPIKQVSAPSEPTETNYEMLPGIFANQGQLAALSNLKKFALGESIMYLLTGFSGSGKTTLVQAWLRDLRESGYQGRVVFTAPTNKAANVLQRMVNRWQLDIECLTCAKLLGLKPVIDFETGRQRFKKSYNDESVIQDYDLVVVDETSMVNEELWRYLAEEANMFTRLLFMGDPAQLPPVNEAISQSFLEINESSHLSEVMRYRGSIAAMADDIRQNLGRRGEPFFETQYNEDGSEGLFVLTQESWNDNIIKAFQSEKYLEDPDYCRVLAYTNKRVASINKMVRAAIRGPKAPRFVDGERLIATEHYSVANPFGGSTTVLNTSSEMEVNGTSIGMEGRWKVWFLDITRFDDGISKLIPVLHEDCQKEFERTQKELKQQAQNGERQLWKQWHENRSRFAYVDYAYSHTIHKAQGSTFTNVFVDVTDILSNKRRNLVQMPGEDKKRWVYERNQLLYVAMTRPSHRLFIFE
ncbi:hypothetical protein D0962_34400 [Leptolyngbyaceae cyanobacterium CCMR0082]|uniref:SWIM-type domain-containing protein n=1 Tax=Adonisia turfae CCMR0082 TaxID=2304604 RepID=A0A6M0SIJ7_9CYAN|nr:AAA family ATPase [Adonisia turfae]NEZ67791.1 hypothetical protein [Adonisia turfae CCMR0082]